jgi:hypothetical protein
LSSLAGAPDATVPTVSRCGPEVGDVFLAAMNRVSNRLGDAFGDAPPETTGIDFLLHNGNDISFMIDSPDSPQTPCQCPTGTCGWSLTVFGACYPQLALSNFMFGFVAGYFGLGDSPGDTGAGLFEIKTWVGHWLEKAEGWSDPIFTGAHSAGSEPAYRGGVAAGRARRNDRSRSLTSADLVAGLSSVATRPDCEPCACVLEAEPQDWSRRSWIGAEPSSASTSRPLAAT